jgi:large subunit ribosomal protein L9
VAGEKFAACQAFAEKLTGVVVKLARKAGVDGRLFGSVTNFDVADALKAQGFDVEKSSVRMPLGPIKIVSETSLQVALHTDVMATITVSVVGEI